MLRSSGTSERSDNIRRGSKCESKATVAHCGCVCRNNVDTKSKATKAYTIEYLVDCQLVILYTETK